MYLGWGAKEIDSFDVVYYLLGNSHLEPFEDLGGVSLGAYVRSSHESDNGRDVIFVVKGEKG